MTGKQKSICILADAADKKERQSRGARKGDA